MGDLEARVLLHRSDAVANQSKVLEAARLVFAEQGLSAEVRDIADRAGVGVATIYRGFGSKDGLVQAAIDQADDAIAALIARAEAAAPPGEPLRLLVAGLVDYADSYGWLIQASVAGTVSARSEASLARRREHRARTRRLIRREIESGTIAAALSEDVIQLALDGAIVVLTIRKMRGEPYPSHTDTVNGLLQMLTGASAPRALEGGK